MAGNVSNGETMPQGRGEDPLLFYTRIFVRFLQAVFATFEKGSYRWLQDDKQTDIIINDQATIQKEVVGTRPAILIARGPVAFTNVACDQFESFGYHNAQRRHLDLMSASVTYNCLSKEGLETQRIAWTAAMATRRLKRSLMRAGMHRVGEDLTVGSESAPGSIVSGDPTEIILVPVTVPFYFPDSWTIEPQEKTLLKNVDIALSSLMRTESETVQIKDPQFQGIELEGRKTFKLTQRVKVNGSSKLGK